jgi:hypothetical protein
MKHGCPFYFMNFSCSILCAGKWQEKFPSTSTYVFNHNVTLLPYSWPQESEEVPHPTEFSSICVKNETDILHILQLDMSIYWLCPFHVCFGNEVVMNTNDSWVAWNYIFSHVVSSDESRGGGTMGGISLPVG